jgi:hypothetical protein
VSDHAWKLSPFIGAGVGARTYHFKSSAMTGQTDLDGYGALGGQFMASRVGARIEVRDYASRFKGLEGEEKTATRNDVMVQGAVTLHM